MIIVLPCATEKAYRLIQEKNTYIFDVPLNANKQQISEAVADQFDVKVSAVKTLVQQGKSVRFSRGKNRYPGTTKRKDIKKAYVTLAKGSSIQVFEEPAAEEEKK